MIEPNVKNIKFGMAMWVKGFSVENSTPKWVKQGMKV